MKSSSTRKSPTPTKSLPPRGAGGGYTLGPRSPVPLPADAVWMTADQVCARYGGRSDMWIHRKLKTDPSFPRPRYSGRLRIFNVREFDEYDAALLSKKIGGESKPTPRKAAQPSSKNVGSGPDA